MAAKKITPEQIKALRLSFGWTSKEMAEKLGVSHDAVRAWECARRTPTSAAVKLLEQLQAKANRKLQTA